MSLPINAITRCSCRPLFQSFSHFRTYRAPLPLLSSHTSNIREFSVSPTPRKQDQVTEWATKRLKEIQKNKTKSREAAQAIRSIRHATKGQDPLDRIAATGRELGRRGMRNVHKRALRITVVGMCMVVLGFGWCMWKIGTWVGKKVGLWGGEESGLCGEK